MAASNRSEQALADGVQDRILAAASTEFAAKGRRGASVRAIALRAGVTAAMINYYFGSKRALYDVVVEEAQARLFASVSSELARAGAADLAARLAAAYFDFLCEERELQQLMLREILDDGDGVQTLVRKYVDPMRALFESQFGADDEMFQAAVSLFGAVAGYFLYAPVLGALRDEDPLDNEHLAKRREHVVALAAKLAEMQGVGAQRS